MLCMSNQPTSNREYTDVHNMLVNGVDLQTLQGTVSGDRRRTGTRKVSVPGTQPEEVTEAIYIGFFWSIGPSKHKQLAQALEALKSLAKRFGFLYAASRWIFSLVREDDIADLKHA